MPALETGLTVPRFPNFTGRKLKSGRFLSGHQTTGEVEADVTCVCVCLPFKLRLCAGPLEASVLRSVTYVLSC